MERIVFTNGCFDILHPGHADLLRRARALGTRLVVGINSDSSVRSIKGPARPIMPEADRAAMLLALRSVDEVRIFDEATPERLIREVCPDVLVKGGDWAEGEIVGAEFVRSNGGEVHSLPLLPGYSTSAIADRLAPAGEEVIPRNESRETGAELEEHLHVMSRVAAVNVASIEDSGAVLVRVLKNGNKVLVCGNGGSAGDAQHLAAELVGRFETERTGLPAIALTTDTSALTAIGNDLGFERIFARQIEALGRPGDALVAISTSGNSPNILNAVMKARESGLITVALTGERGRKLAALCDHAVLVPSTRTARIQEAHITVVHLWCRMVDRFWSGEDA